MKNKDITINFKTDQDVKKALEWLADEERRSLSSLIESILYNYVKEKNLLPDSQK